MITLNEIAYNIKNLAYGGKYSTESSITISQIKHWIHYHRAKLIADNIDKGITNDNNIYQNAELTFPNSTIRMFSTYGGFQGYSGYYNSPFYSPNSGQTYQWVPYSSITYAQEGQAYYDQREIDRSSKNYYGIETRKSQNKGDFRNFGWMSFHIPETIQLKDDRGIKRVSIERQAFVPRFTTATLTQAAEGGTFTTFGTANKVLNEDGNLVDPLEIESTTTTLHALNNRTNSIELYRKDSGNFDEFNKFTNANTPNYEQYRAPNDSTLNEAYQFGGNVLKLNNLKVSPTYIGDKVQLDVNTPVFGYDGIAELILENPTHIDQLARVKYRGTTEQKFDHSSTAYPIPLEYVSDLVQRVLQIEIQTELKTISENVSDGLDDSVKLKTASRGPQVQR